MNTARRQFLRIVPAAGLAVVCGQYAHAADLDPKDPQAVALGYLPDTTKVDKAKYPKHDVSQQCANCQLYQGKASDPTAPCALFAGKSVAAKGWCSAWVKKA